jgi:glutathione synthase
MNICFIMYPWNEVEPENDTTLRIIHESYIRGHKVALTSSHNLTIRNSSAYSFCRLLNIADKEIKSVEAFYKKATFNEKLLPLNGFDIIFIRQNPPLEANTLSFLDSVKDHTLIVNSVEGLRKASNKIYTAAFGEEFKDIIPTTHVSKNKEYLKRMIKESPNDKMILKPLIGHGGSGVIILEKNADKNINSLLDFYIDGKHESHYVILQDYVSGAEKGDVRVLMLNGEAIGAMKRIPHPDDARSNVHVGGTVEKHVLTKQEKLICQAIGPRLVKDGLYFVGLDIINGKLIEINVCAPGGIARINRLNKVKLQVKVLDFVEKLVNEKEKLFNEKASMRKFIQDT